MKVELLDLQLYKLYHVDVPYLNYVVEKSIYVDDVGLHQVEMLIVDGRVDMLQVHQDLAVKHQKLDD